MIIDLKEKFSLKNDQASLDEIQDRIESGAKVTGTNMFILIFAILIACIGLNMNSTAIVIGAMLISPLMGTIISIAYGFANNDLKWIRKSFTSFLFQVIVAIISSTIYFFISPINTFSGELAARTHPSIWDVLIAVFGGFAAIIANTRKNYLGNVIAGTAIATALMPPLCTIGYCIASFKWISALGATYLFTINTIFICLSSLLGLHLMKINSNKKILSSVKSKVILTVLLVVMIIPSFILAWQTVRESSAEKNFNSFINNEFNFENSQVVTSDIDLVNKTINISIIGSTIPDESIDIIKGNLKKYDLDDFKLNIIQTYVEKGITAEDVKILFENSDVSMENSSLQNQLEEARILLNIRQKEDLLKNEIAKEICILFPEINYSGFTTLQNKDGSETFTVILGINGEPDMKYKETISEWIKYKLDIDENINILFVQDTKKESVH